MEGSDEHALDLLSSPNAVNVSLQRRIDFNPNAHRRQLSYQIVNWEGDVLSLGTAVWWPDDHTTGVRTLNGEIQLKKDLEPSLAVLDCSIKVSIHTILKKSCLCHAIDDTLRLVLCRRLPL